MRDWPLFWARCGMVAASVLPFLAVAFHAPASLLWYCVGMQAGPAVVNLRHRDYPGATAWGAGALLCWMVALSR